MAMKIGVLRPRHLIDVKPIAALRGIRRTDGTLTVGAGVTHWELERDATVAAAIPAFAELERGVANVRVRATGTLGGNIAFAEPHADPPTMLAALGARVVLEGKGGRRALAIDEFVTGMYTTALAEDEVMTAVEIPVPPAGTRVAYTKFQILERPSVGVAIVASLRGGRFAGAPAVVVGAADEMPRRVDTAALAGADPRAAGTADAIGEAAQRSVDPVGDLAGSAEYKRHLVGVFTRRTLASLVAQAA